jgi:hypothetical protein
MTFDYVLGRATPGTRSAFTVQAMNRAEADFLLVTRLLATGWSPQDLLYWHVVSVVELGRRA